MSALMGINSSAQLPLLVRADQVPALHRTHDQPRNSPPNSPTELACGPMGPSVVACVTYTMVPTFNSSKLPSIMALRVK